MEFSSVIFIWAFLPLTLLFYYGLKLLPIQEEKKKPILNGILLFFSLVFYLWAGIREFFLFIAMMVLNYGAGRLINYSTGQEQNSSRRQKAIFIGAVCANLLVLIFFKYFNMLVSLAHIFLKPRGSLIEYFYALAVFEGTGASQIYKITLPLAISFTTFQSISYLADIRRGKIRAEKNFLNYSLYICFFPQLIQGPIMRFPELGSQIKSREHSSSRFSEGITRFCCGLGKKVLIANTLAGPANTIWSKSPSNLYTAEAWLGLILFILQIYYDFSGYSDMAVGLGKMFGFEICENFDYPLTSLSMQEIWHRWHISLSSWFRDYVYIPLGGSKKGAFRTYLNLLIVFLLTGIWHGANLNYILWGILVAVQIIIERLFLGKLLKKNPIKPLNWIYLMVSFMSGGVLFRSPSLYHAVKYFEVLFGRIPESVGSSLLSYFNADLFIALTAAVLCIGFLQKAFRAKYQRIRDSIPVITVRSIFIFAVFIWSLMSLMNGSYNPSIYAAF